MRNQMMMKLMMKVEMVQVKMEHLFGANMEKYNDDMNVEVADDQYYLER